MQKYLPYEIFEVIISLLKRDSLYNQDTLHNVSITANSFRVEVH